MKTRSIIRIQVDTTPSTTPGSLLLQRGNCQQQQEEPCAKISVNTRSEASLFNHPSTTSSPQLVSSLRHQPQPFQSTFPQHLHIQQPEHLLQHSDSSSVGRQQHSVHATCSLEDNSSLAYQRQHPISPKLISGDLPFGPTRTSGAAVDPSTDCGDIIITEVTSIPDEFTGLGSSSDCSGPFLLPAPHQQHHFHNSGGMMGGGGGGMVAGAGQPEVVGPESQFSLRWNNHTSTFCHVLSALRDKDKYSDVTLACEGRFYNVHRLVLGVCSDYFDAMLERTPCKHPVIVLKDVKAEDLEALLSYMYIGEVSVSQNDLSRVIKAAELLCIKGLAIPDVPPPGYADAATVAAAAAGLGAGVVREKQPGLIYAAGGVGGVMTFVTHAAPPQQQMHQETHQQQQQHHHHQQQQQQQHVANQQQQQQQQQQSLSFRGSTPRSSPMPNKRRRKDHDSNVSHSSNSNNINNTIHITTSSGTNSGAVSMVNSSAPGSILTAGNTIVTTTPSTSSSTSIIDSSTSVTVDETSGLVYHQEASSPQPGGNLGVGDSQRSTPDFDGGRRVLEHQHLKEAQEQHSLLQVVDNTLVKEEGMDENGGASVVASVLTGKNPPTISYVVTTDHAGNLHAQPHDHRFDPSPGGQQGGGGGQGGGPQPLAEAVAEALAGPSGMQTWLSGGELSQAGFATVESYTTNSSGSSAGDTHHDMKQHTVSAAQQHSLDQPPEPADPQDGRLSPEAEASVTELGENLPQQQHFDEGQQATAGDEPHTSRDTKVRGDRRLEDQPSSKPERLIRVGNIHGDTQNVQEVGKNESQSSKQQFRPELVGKNKRKYDGLSSHGTGKRLCKGDEFLDSLTCSSPENQSLGESEPVLKQVEKDSHCAEDDTEQDVRQRHEDRSKLVEPDVGGRLNTDCGRASSEPPNQSLTRNQLRGSKDSAVAESHEHEATAEDLGMDWVKDAGKLVDTESHEVKLKDVSSHKAVSDSSKEKLIGNEEELLDAGGSKEEEVRFPELLTSNLAETIERSPSSHGASKVSPIAVASLSEANSCDDKPNALLPVELDLKDDFTDSDDDDACDGGGTSNHLLFQDFDEEGKGDSIAKGESVGRKDIPADNKASSVEDDRMARKAERTLSKTNRKLENILKMSSVTISRVAEDDDDASSSGVIGSDSRPGLDTGIDSRRCTEGTASRKLKPDLKEPQQKSCNRTVDDTIPVIKCEDDDDDICEIIEEEDDNPSMFEFGHMAFSEEQGIPAAFTGGGSQQESNAFSSQNLDHSLFRSYEEGDDLSSYQPSDMTETIRLLTGQSESFTQGFSGLHQQQRQFSQSHIAKGRLGSAGGSQFHPGIVAASTSSFPSNLGSISNVPSASSSDNVLGRLDNQQQHHHTNPDYPATSTAAHGLSAQSLHGLKLPSYTCPYCQRSTFKQKSDLNRHIRIHTGEKPFKCPYCEYCSTQSAPLKSHVFRKHREKMEEFNRNAPHNYTTFTSAAAASGMGEVYP